MILSAWQERVDLAAAFRLAVRFGYHESIANHFTLAVSDDGDRFLVNPWGLHWAEIRASDILLVDGTGAVLEGEGEAETTSVCIHAPMHRRLPHARCVLHTHMPYATALTAVEGGRLEMINQSSARFYDQVAYDDEFNAMALSFDEGERICSALGNRSVLFMVNHGVTVTGRTVGEAFDALYYLERACEHQWMAMATGLPLKRMSDEVARTTARQWAQDGWGAEAHFAALKRLLDREGSDYAS
jgi:ribulose-5-phosphate 4-epimerase/fuculose-1-phosphate aldolase